MHKIIGAVALCGLLAGCAASGPMFADMKLEAVAPDRGRLVVFREGGFIRAGEQPSVIVDGSSIGSLARGGFLVSDVPLGEHVVLVKATLDKGSVARFKAEPGQTVYLGVLNGHVTIGLGLIPIVLENSMKGGDAPVVPNVDNTGAFQLRFADAGTADPVLRAARLSH